MTYIQMVEQLNTAMHGIGVVLELIFPFQAQEPNVNEFLLRYGIVVTRSYSLLEVQLLGGCCQQRSGGRQQPQPHRRTAS